MKHKKHLRKQGSGNLSENIGGSEEKDSSDNEDIQGDGDDEQDDEIDQLSHEKISCADGNYETDGVATSQKKIAEKSLEGKIHNITTYLNFMERDNYSWITLTKCMNYFRNLFCF